jgi:histidinol dehydrogenase
MTRFLDARETGFAEDFAQLIAARGARLDEAEIAAREIVQRVREGGVAAVLDFVKRFDGVELTEKHLRVTSAEIDHALAACPPDLVKALEHAADRIAAFHVRERPQDGGFIDEDGVSLGWRWNAVDSAGLYAPGGLAAYPSSVLMNAIPAKAAGVARLAMATPPARLFDNPAILAAAKIAGVDEIWKIGGAHAIAALAFGAGPLQACDVVVGPGNAYVAAAKKIVFGAVGVDAVAGPSEIFILCDGSLPPEWIAADLLAQAEHDEDAQSVLFTQDRAFGEAVSAAVEKQIAAGQAGKPARVSWERHGAIVIVGALEDAAPYVNQAAPEHVEIATEQADRLAGLIRHAGAIFLGAYAPEAFGDYIAGPSHVLPTSRAARFSAGVSTFTFMKRTSLIGADAQAAAAIGPNAARLADSEGLPAHALSVRLRLPGGGGG